jgi:DNA-binding LacI/PurR family transcriptional regulator
MATVYEVAERSGVSHTTVSNVYRKPEKVSAAVTERVLTAARELGFGGPNRAAAALRTGRMGTIGVVLTESLTYAFSDPAAVALLQGIASVGLNGAGITILPIEDESRAAEVVATAAIDGLILYSLPADHPAIVAARSRSLPTVWVDAGAQRRDVWVGIDDRSAAADAARHLHDLGHRRVVVLADWLRKGRSAGVIDLHRDALRDDVAVRRVRGYLDVFNRADVVIYDCGANSLEAGRVAVHAVFDEADHPPTAVLAISDELARGTLTAAAERGLIVPHALSVIGFDDAPQAESAGLTTVRQPLIVKGRRAAELLMSLMAGDRPSPLHHRLDASLVLRQTTGPVGS